MSQRINPFHELYRTESISEDQFVNLFSPMFVDHARSLYQPGNVILKGLQGSGKTMLLNLLKPDVRIAYRKAKISFPVPSELGKFIASGINFRKSGVAQFGHLIDKESSSGSVKELALFFGDFVNYWLVYDLIVTIEVFKDSGDEALLKEIGINNASLEEFSRLISADPCWFGYLDNVDGLSGLKKRIQQKITTYRKYINLNIDDLPEDIETSKTVIGEPISKVAKYLRESKVIDKDVNVFIRLDQYEELPTLDHSGKNLGEKFQEMIHKAISTRDSSVSYRIGSRQYAWPETPKIFSTDGILENKRDYSTINIDDVLRRKENRSTWIFPKFAEDIFQRRLKFSVYKYDSLAKNPSLLDAVFGKPLTPSGKAMKLVSNPESRRRLAKIDSEWPDAWKEFLLDLYEKDPFSAKLAESWVRQEDSKKRGTVNKLPLSPPYPWEKKQYWKKERSEQALVQIASRNKQQLVWSGKDDLLGLSGGNILVFLFICQNIWDAWLRDTRNDKNADNQLPEINKDVQSLGVLNASEEWLRKPNEGEQSKKRSQLIKLIGARYYKILTDDIAMSNPGKNGFSISNDSLKKDNVSREILELTVNYGDLYDHPHTSKSKGEKRTKYYLAPILCPSFKITYKHIKEPEYIDLPTLQKWLSNVEKKRKVAKNSTGSSSIQGKLF